MRFYISLVLSAALLIACESNQKTSNQKISNEKTSNENTSNIHEIIVQEVIQVKEYTYLRVLENEKEKWVAAPSFKAEVGKTYYFKNGMEMPNFKSNELNRVFETIYFVEAISTDSNGNNIQSTITTNTLDLSEKVSKPKLERKDVKIEPINGTITIAQLYGDMKSFEGKTIRVRGKVTKFNPAIMNKNWIHIQDGTESNGKFDLTLVTSEEATVGDIIVVEGEVSLNKDFGYGYFYELIVENAKLIK
ncbi:hypothetical protein [Lutibacter sp.]